ncbi:MAG: GtrA family protein [Roseitalea porphyridii]|uniref:GtrA family protein n=1 Tax=Roseitalea porphyridii TaxID=1852022 RepID=UPI0005855AD1
MMQSIRQLSKPLALTELVRFCMVGATTLALYVVLFVLLSQIAEDHFLPALSAGTVAALVSFILQRNWTFRSKAAVQDSLPKFLLIHGAAAALNALCVEFAAGTLGLPVYAALTFGAAVYGAFSYLAQKLWCFRP